VSGKGGEGEGGWKKAEDWGTPRKSAFAKKETSLGRKTLISDSLRKREVANGGIDGGSRRVALTKKKKGGIGEFSLWRGEREKKKRCKKYREHS